MSLAITTNIASLVAQRSVSKNSNNLSASLKKLSSGLRINSAADDASGMIIADSLRSQRLGLGQAIKNANDGISIMQIADSALEESVNIINTIKQKSIQAASDTQTSETRKAIQNDINKLLEQFDNISKTTSFNGQKLLSGNFVNKHIQVGAYSGEIVGISIASAESTKNGHINVSNVSPDAPGIIHMTTTNNTNGESIITKDVDLQYNNDPDNGLGAVADEINQWSELTDIKAVAVVEAQSQIQTGETGSDFTINGIHIGNIAVNEGDANYALVSAINHKSLETGVVASITSEGNLHIVSNDGRAIQVDGLKPPEIINSDQLTTIGTIKVINTGYNAFEINTVRPANTLYTSEIPDDTDVYFNPDTKHFYQFINAENISWDTAKNEAENQVLQGMTGYLATITSADENEFVYNLISRASWIGASRADNSDEWRWVTGPEGLEDEGQGRYFFHQNVKGGDSVNDEYSNWNQTTPEPNDAYSNSENWAYIGDLTGGGAGVDTWANRLISGLNHVDGYLVEYGGMPGDPEIIIGNPPDPVLEITDIQNYTLSDINVLSGEDSQIGIELADKSLEDIDKIRSSIGSSQNQLESTISNLSTTKINIASSESVIRDVDFAEESRVYAQMNVLSQASTFALAQVNEIRKEMLQQLLQ